MIFADGTSPPRDTSVVVTVPNGIGLLIAKSDDKGRFELDGIPDGPVWFYVGIQNNDPKTRFHFSAKNRCLNPRQPKLIEGQVNRDITDLKILLEPGAGPPHRFRNQLDPAVVADFDEAGPARSRVCRPDHDRTR